MQCIILAGGFATRLWPLSEKRAKPLLHLKDKPLIEHIIEGIPKEIQIIISVNQAFAEGIQKWSKNIDRQTIEVVVEDSLKDAEKKGALAATAMVIEEKNIQEDLLLIAGDNYFGFEMQKFIDAFSGNPILAAYDIKEQNLARKFGVVVARDKKVVEFQEKPENPKSTLVSTGCYLFPQKNLADIIHYSKEHNDNLGGVFEHLLQKGETIDVFDFNEKWFDIGSFDAYLAANRDLIGDDVITEENVQLTVNNQFSGSIFIGQDSTIQSSTLENVIVMPGCHIEDCVIRNCVIDENAHLKGIDLTHQMVRAGSRIEK